ncbi:MAG: hypothetical protein AB7U05_04480 [Mangrovibacterium sp.]
MPAGDYLSGTATGLAGMTMKNGKPSGAAICNRRFLKLCDKKLLVV